MRLLTLMFGLAILSACPGPKEAVAPEPKPSGSPEKLLLEYQQDVEDALKAIHDSTPSDIEPPYNPESVDYD